jgi:hypothetical protein
MAVRTHARPSLSLGRPKSPAASASRSDLALLFPFYLPEKKKQKLSEIQADVQESESLVKNDATQILHAHN